MINQLVNPNFDVVETAGWCLQYARRVFGAPAVESTAWQAWMMTEHPHEDRNFPDGVAVPVWFDWKGDVGDGFIFRYGHAAVRAADGKIWSSPLSGRGSARFNSVDDLTRAFGNGMKYVGWSDDISNVKVIELGDKTMDRETVNYAYRSVMDTEPTDEQVKYWVGREAKELLIGLYKGSEQRRYKANNYDRDVDAARKTAAQPSDADKKLQAIKDALGVK
jgi:hypothetical protein